MNNLALLTFLSAAFALSPMNVTCPLQVLDQIVLMANEALKDNQHFPIDGKELDEHCSIFKKLLSDVQELMLPCLPGFLKVFLPDILSGVLDVEDRMCNPSNGDLRKRYLHEAACLREKEARFGPCSHQMSRAMYNASVNRSIGEFCCAIPKWKKCSGDAAMLCGHQALSFINDFISNMEGELIRGFCAGCICTD